MDPHYPPPSYQQSLQQTTLTSEFSKMEVSSKEKVTSWAGYEIVVCVDISGSMDESVEKGSEMTRIKFVQNKITSFVKNALKFDDNGIGFITFNGQVSDQKTIKDEKDVKRIFKELEPSGFTNTHDLIQNCYDLHLEYKRNTKNFKGTVVIVITDGQPTRFVNKHLEDDTERVMKKMEEISRKVPNDKELGYTFLQVGRDPYATQFLQRMDDFAQMANPNEPNAIKDIVDHKSMHDLNDEGQPLTIERIIQDCIDD
jgi:uncharacterized protein YegL